MVAEISILGRIVDFLSSAPTDNSILEVKATDAETQRLEHLNVLLREGTISQDERDELREALIAEQLMIIAKANAFGRIKAMES